MWFLSSIEILWNCCTMYTLTNHIVISPDTGSCPFWCIRTSVLILKLIKHLSNWIKHLKSYKIQIRRVFILTWSWCEIWYMLSWCCCMVEIKARTYSHLIFPLLVELNAWVMKWKLLFVWFWPLGLLCGLLLSVVWVELLWYDALLFLNYLPSTSSTWSVTCACKRHGLGYLDGANCFDTNPDVCVWACVRAW